MGMGDKKIPYKPKYAPVRCSKCGNDFSSGMVRKCAHEAVNRVYGTNICVYCCRGCKFVIKSDIGDIYKCGYGGAA